MSWVRCLKSVFISFDRFPPIIPIALMPQLSIMCTVIGVECRNSKDTHVKDPERHMHTGNTYTYARRHPQPGPLRPHNGHLNRPCWHLWNWFPMAARSIYCYKHWAAVTSCWHRTQSLLLVCIVPVAQWKKTRTRGCPEGCDASSLRFNVNLILSLVLRRFRLHNRRGEEQFCNQRLLLPEIHTQTHQNTHTLAPISTEIEEEWGVPSQFQRGRL